MERTLEKYQRIERSIITTYRKRLWSKFTKAIKEYISDQIKRDRESDQLSLFDPRDPFMGSK